MRTLAIALVLGLVGAGTASAEAKKPQARHVAKKPARIKHAKAKIKHAGPRHASLTHPAWMA